MPSLPVAQSRNVFEGMGVSCLAGLFWQTVLGNQVWLAALLGVAFSIMGMQLTATLHREALLYILQHVKSSQLLLLISSSLTYSLRTKALAEDIAAWLTGQVWSSHKLQLT